MERGFEVLGSGLKVFFDVYGYILGRKKLWKEVFLVIFRGMFKGVKLENFWILLIIVWV